MKIFYYIIFACVAALAYFGLNYYVYSRMSGVFSLTGPARGVFRWGFILLALTFIFGELLGRRFPVYPLVFAGGAWLGIIAISFSVFLLRDAVRLGLPSSADISGRISVYIIAVMVLWGFVNVLLPPSAREVKLRLKGLPAGLKGFKIVQLSDLHLGAGKTAAWLDRVVNTANGMDADVIALTGDILDEDICSSGNFCGILKKLKARHGIFAVTGNHEYYSGIKRFMNFASEAGITPLRNSSAVVAGGLVIAGVDDRAGERFGQGGPDLDRALDGRPEGLPVVLMNHQPVDFSRAVASGVSLQLSGHTHAGQVPPLEPFIWLIYRYTWGLAGLKDSYIYTSSGTGTWGPPLRVFSRSEIVKFILE